MKWINVKDGLPEMFTDVIVKLFDNDGGYKLDVDSLQQRNFTDAQGKLTQLKTWGKCQTSNALYVTHWMPLPKPPESFKEKK